MSTRKLTGPQLRKFRADIAKLKSKGLVSKRVDARSQKPTSHMISQINRFGDVLTGKAKVVHVPKRSIAKEFAENDRFRVKGKSVVIPAQPDERFAFSKKNNTISSTRTVKGQKVVRDISAKPISKSNPPRGGNVFYVIPLGNTRQSFDRWEDLVLFMEPYENQARNPYKNWEKYVEIVRAENGESAEDYDEME